VPICVHFPNWEASLQHTPIEKLSRPFCQISG